MEEACRKTHIGVLLFLGWLVDASIIRQEDLGRVDEYETLAVDESSGDEYDSERQQRFLPAVGVRFLVERFDIEPYSDFSSK